jgi:hypothetical protein
LIAVAKGRTGRGAAATATLSQAVAVIRGSRGWKPTSAVPNMISDFGKNQQYGPLLSQNYTTAGGGSVARFNDFENILPHNPCPQQK